MSSHKSTRKASAKVAFNDSDSLLRFADEARQRGDGVAGRRWPKG
jgi:hypothetical protein